MYRFFLYVHRGERQGRGGRRLVIHEWSARRSKLNIIYAVANLCGAEPSHQKRVRP
jgi:hypothetical protein